VSAAADDGEREVVGPVHRHRAQRPEGDVTGTKWRRPPTNRGHDPLT
jgi:hypothetical protein